MSPFANIRQKHFSRLDEQQQVYLDYTGSGLYPSILVDRHHELLRNSVAGNPHSSNPPSQLSTSHVESARRSVLSFFHADPRLYTVIFTANASAAIKLVGESFPFQRGSTFLLASDNHNSVLGIREYAKRASASVRYVPLTRSLRLDASVDAELASPRHRTAQHPSLFAFPAQSNFSGVRHPLGLVGAAAARGWFTLLDAAAFVPTSPLDLSAVHPHFVPVSFYKMLGFPTGVGALLVRRDALPHLRRPSFAGGTVAYSSVLADTHTLLSDASGFEDGTPNFLALAAVPKALGYLARIGMDRVHAHVDALAGRMLQGLLEARWPSGARQVHVYGPRNMTERGGTFAFDIVREDGSRVDARLFERAAARQRIALRVGCFCNPGAAERAIGVERRDLERCVAKLGHSTTAEQVGTCLGVGFFGCVRVSVGLVTNRADVDKFLSFLRRFCHELDEK